jgi:hypothetical protein
MPSPQHPAQVGQNLVAKKRDYSFCVLIQKEALSLSKRRTPPITSLNDSENEVLKSLSCPQKLDIYYFPNKDSMM